MRQAAGFGISILEFYIIYTKLVNHNLGAKSGPPLVYINKTLLEYSCSLAHFSMAGAKNSCRVGSPDVSITHRPELT